MITKETPEGKVLLVTWRTIIGMSATVSEHYRWIVTGIAAVLAVVIANLKPIQEVVHDGYLKTAVSLLVVSVFLSSVAYMLSLALKVRVEVMDKVEGILTSPAGQSVMADLKVTVPELNAEMCRPFFGPMKWLMLRAAQKSALDPFSAERGSIRLLVWQAYAMWASLLLATLSLALIVLGLR